MTNTEYAIAMLTAIRDCNKFVMTGENHNCGDGTCEACKLYSYVYADTSKKIEALGTAIKHMEALEKIKEDIENMKVVGYACDPEGFVEDEIVSKTDVEDIIDKYTEGLI